MSLGRCAADRDPEEPEGPLVSTAFRVAGSERQTGGK